MLNKFDDLGEVVAEGGAGSTAQGGEGDTGGSGAASGTGATGGGGTAGKAGSAAGGEGGSPTDEPLVGAIVIGQRVGTGTAAKNHIVVLDPADGSEVARSETEQVIHAIGYEAPRDKWFVFTGTTGPGGPSTILVGSVNRRGFVQESMTVVADGKPTGQGTMTVLNRRILYRTVQSNGTTTADKLVLLDTSTLGELRLRGFVDVPAANKIFSTLGRPSPTGEGGRVTFLHFNRDGTECVVQAGSQRSVCPVKTSTTLITAAVTNPTAPATPTLVDLIGREGSNPAGATDFKNGFDYIVVPPDPEEGSKASVYKFDSSSTLQGQGVDLDLGTVQDATVSMSGAIIDPCVERIVTAEQANTRKLYAIQFSGGAVPTSLALNGSAGALVYEPYTKTVIQFLQDPTSPSFRGFELAGAPATPTLTERGASQTRPWMPPTDLNPSIVVTKTPLQAPCGT